MFDENFVRQIMEDVKPQYLLNMAWVTTGDYLESNLNYKFLDAGMNLLKYFGQNGGKRAVFAGTCFEYELGKPFLKETDKLAPEKTIYTLCKNKLRESAEIYCKTNGISFGYGRIFYVYGRKEHPSRLGGRLAERLSKNEEITITTKSLLRDYMYTKDIAGGFAKFLDSNVEGVVNICTGKPISIGDFALEFGKQAGKENLIILKEEPSNQPEIISGDNTRLLNEVGYEIRYTLSEAVSEILANA